VLHPPQPPFGAIEQQEQLQNGMPSPELLKRGRAGSLIDIAALHCCRFKIKGADTNGQSQRQGFDGLRTIAFGGHGG
jgi:hypothetical protein